jgi:hypothetical protein
MLVDSTFAQFVDAFLGGDVFSEAIVIHKFSRQNDAIKISEFEFGRP